MVEGAWCYAVKRSIQTGIFIGTYRTYSLTLYGAEARIGTVPLFSTFSGAGTSRISTWTRTRVREPKHLVEVGVIVIDHSQQHENYGNNAYYEGTQKSRRLRAAFGGKTLFSIVVLI
jgi:hypothetical protein